MRIRLDLIQKDKRILLLLHSLSRQHTDLKIQIFHRPRLGKEPVTQRILHQIDLNEVFKELLPHVANEIGLSHLSGPVDE